MIDLRFAPRLCYCRRHRLRALSIRAEVANVLGMGLLLEACLAVIAGVVKDAFSPSELA